MLFIRNQGKNKGRSQKEFIGIKETSQGSTKTDTLFNLQQIAVQDLYNFFRRSKKIIVNLGNNKFKRFIFAMQVFLKPQRCTANHRGHIAVPSQSI